MFEGLRYVRRMGYTLNSLASAMRFWRSFGEYCLKYVRRMRYTAVELNVDYVSLEKTIKEGVTDSRLGRALVNKIRRLLEMDWNRCCFSFISRGQSVCRCFSQHCLLFGL